MDLPLPLDQFRFNLVLRILITAYWASWIWNFIAFVPGNYKDDDADILWYSNKSNYSFWLISSLIFFLLWISQFQYIRLTYITIAEIFIIIICYMYLCIYKRKYMKKNERNIKELRKRNKEEIYGKKH